MPPFGVLVSQVGKATVVTVVGEVDMATSGDLQRAIEVIDGAPRRVVVDLSEVTYFDSNGLAALLRSQRALAGRDIEICVVCPDEAVARRVFEIAHAVESLALVTTLDGALE